MGHAAQLTCDVVKVTARYKIYLIALLILCLLSFGSELLVATV